MPDDVVVFVIAQKNGEQYRWLEFKKIRNVAVLTSFPISGDL